jgi:hypothetical protein
VLTTKSFGNCYEFTIESSITVNCRDARQLSIRIDSCKIRNVCMSIGWYNPLQTSLGAKDDCV